MPRTVKIGIGIVLVVIAVAAVISLLTSNEQHIGRPPLAIRQIQDGHLEIGLASCVRVEVTRLEIRVWPSEVPGKPGETVTLQWQLSKPPKQSTYSTASHSSGQWPGLVSFKGRALEVLVEYTAGTAPAQFRTRSKFGMAFNSSTLLDGKSVIAGRPKSVRDFDKFVQSGCPRT